jgi:hypothetical protein
MKGSGYDAEPVIGLWAEIAQNDLLPEVRLAEVPTLKFVKKQ